VLSGIGCRGGRAGEFLRRDSSVNLPVLSAMEHSAQAPKIDFQSV